MTTLEQISRELGETVKLVEDFGTFLIVASEDGTRYSSKLTKTLKHKKNSVRLWLM